MPRRTRAAGRAESVPATLPGRRSRRSACRRFSARLRSATRSISVSQKAGAAPPSCPGDLPPPAARCARRPQGGGEGIEPIVLAGVAAREHPHPCRELGRHVHHRLAACCQPPRLVTTLRPAAFSTAQRRSGNRLAQRSRSLKPARSCGKLARSRSSPNASSTAATANDALSGDRPR